MYDIVYIGNDESNWKNVKKKFFTAKRADSLDSAKRKVFTKMFWVIWNDITPLDSFDFSYEADNWSLDVTHVFKNGEKFDGVCLFPKDVILTDEEISQRQFIHKKEVDITASKSAEFEKIYAKDYDDYKEKLKNVTSEFVWIIPSDISVNFDFNYQVSYWDKDLVFLFKNHYYNDGIFLQHKDFHVSRREYDYAWFAKKIDVEINASSPIPYDIVFISYNEPNADENFECLLEQFPDRVIHRVHGITGIHQAHIEAAKVCDTSMFWIVDADAIIVDDFKFDYQVPRWQHDHVFVWRSQNPVNDLVYGYGGVKLFPTSMTINMDVSNTDMTTSISRKFNAIKKIANITSFNTGEFESWKSAFRECCKLSSKIIDRQKDEETNNRLKIWCTVGADKPFGKYVIAGAKSGAAYGARYQGDNEALKKINDFDWLQEQFKNANI